MKIRVGLEGRDEIAVECAETGVSAPGAPMGAVKFVSFVGCWDFMNMMQKMKKSFGADIAKWPVPQGQDHGSLLLREMVLKLRGEWQFPYEHAEICHCRSVATQLVDQAVIAGAHTPEVVTRQTSASTACGTCKPDVQKIIDYRLGKTAS